MSNYQLSYGFSRSFEALAEIRTVNYRTASADRSRLCRDKNYQLSITQQSCPLWVPLIEAGEHDSDGADFFVRKYLDELLARDPLIDTIVLGCTHYPLLLHKIEEYLQGKPITVISQGELVANSLADYLIRHPEIERDCSKGGTCRYLTTEAADRFSDSARIFINQPVTAEHVSLEHLEK